MRRDFPGVAEFLLIYVREAHASDEWVTPDNPKAGISVAQPRTLEERCAVAATCDEALGVSFPVLVDGLDDAVSRAYGAWPERLYVIGADGIVLYRGGMGPFGFEPGELRPVLERLRGAAGSP